MYSVCFNVSIETTGIPLFGGNTRSSSSNGRARQAKARPLAVRSHCKGGASSIAGLAEYAAAASQKLTDLVYCAVELYSKSDSSLTTACSLEKRHWQAVVVDSSIGVERGGGSSTAPSEE